MSPPPEDEQDPDSEDELSQLRASLLGLERLLLDPVRRADPASIADLFADNFREFGKSGRAYDKVAILATLHHENQPGRRVEIENFRVVPLAASVALVTYTSVVRQASTPEARSLRSSIWSRTGAKWRIIFHQGTPIPNAWL